MRCFSLLVAGSLTCFCTGTLRADDSSDTVMYKTLGQVVVAAVESVAGSVLLHEGYKWLVTVNPDVAHAHSRLQAIEDRYQHLPEKIAAERDALITRLQTLLSNPAADCQQGAVITAMIAELQKRFEQPILGTPEALEIESLANVANRIHRREIARQALRGAPATVAGLLLLGEAAVRSHLLVLGRPPGVLAMYEYMSRVPEKDQGSSMQPVGLAEDLH